MSGSAYRETHDRGFHHGTLLLDADLGRLAHYLNPDPKKLAAKGYQLGESRVANLGELLLGLGHEQVVQALATPSLPITVRWCPAHLPERMPDLPGCRFARQRSWGGTSAHAPAFSHLLEALPLGRGRASFRRGEGVIGRAQIFSDTLDPAPLDDLAARLPGWPIVPGHRRVAASVAGDVFGQPELEGFRHGC